MPATVGQLLRDAAVRLTESGTDTPRLDAEVLLGHVLRVDRATLLAGPEAGVGAEAAHEFADLVERRASGEPVSYIRGIKEFYGLALTMDRRALIPRPETETLVDLALARLTSLLTRAPRDAGEPLLIWDVGTGSGAIAISVAVECRKRGYAGDVRIRATDGSSEALSLAVENAVVHGVADVIDFATADLTGEANSTTTADQQGVDLLLANLPYIATDVVATLPIAASFEPRAALDGGPDGLHAIGRLITELPHALAAGGTALLEIGADQGEAVPRLVADLGSGWQSVVHHDLAERPRVVEISRTGT
jgi:release factor glutamine methyltransferase